MSDPESEALAAYWRFFDGCNSRDSHYPYLVIRPGRVETFSDPTDLLRCLPGTPLHGRAVRALHAGPTGATVAFEAKWSGRPVRGICLVRVEHGDWRIKSGSFVSE
ncbi:MAG: hypothetical protein OXH68_10725 [Gammaproteobacteria bacterium]|nr:hypothetical protein [Gammaproteobacteria bacterium]